MQQRTVASELTDQQRIAIFYCTTLSIEEAFQLQDSDINYKLLHEKRCSPEALLLAGLTPQHLYIRGADTAIRLRSLGFDAIHLRDENFCRQAISAISAKAIADTFVQGVGSVISICGSSAPRLLGLSVENMLNQCVAQPHAAEIVLTASVEAASAVEALQGVAVDTLMATCIGSKALKRCGIRMAHLVRAISIDSHQLSLMGYEIGI